jgi:hypothetical protein
MRCKNEIEKQAKLGEPLTQVGIGWLRMLSWGHVILRISSELTPLFTRVSVSGGCLPVTEMSRVSTRAPCLALSLCPPLR